MVAQTANGFCLRQVEEDPSVQEALRARNLALPDEEEESSCKHLVVVPIREGIDIVGSLELYVLPLNGQS